MVWHQAASLPVWKEMPKYYVQEMGRSFDLDAPEGRNIPTLYGTEVYEQPRETYLVPGSFRCVR